MEHERDKAIHRMRVGMSAVEKTVKKDGSPADVTHGDLADLSGPKERMTCLSQMLLQLLRNFTKLHNIVELNISSSANSKHVPPHLPAHTCTQTQRSPG